MRRKLIPLMCCVLAGCLGSDRPLVDGRPLSKSAPGPVGVQAFRFGQPQIVLLVTGGDCGAIELCDCPGPMPGGLSRRSGLVLSYRAIYPGTVVIDTGDSFSRSGEDIVNEFVLHAYRQIGYDAVVLGDQEWALPFPELRRILRPGGPQYLSTTVREAQGPIPAQQLPLTRVVKRQIGSAKLAILSDLRAAWMSKPRPAGLGELAFAEPGELAAQVDRLHAEGYVVAVVCHGSDEALEQTADSCAADVFLRGHKNKSQTELSTVKGRPVVRVWGTQHVGVLGIQLSPDGKIAGVEYRLELVDPRWPVDDRLLQTYRDYTHLAMQGALQAKPRPGLEYASSQQCGACHKPQYEKWTTTKHSRAYESLVKVKRTDDPACLACHTSGFGTVKGFSTIEKTAHLAGVNCQNCHQMDFTAHTKNGRKPAPPTQALCSGCHTEVTDPPFEFSTRLAEVRCPTAKIMAPAKP